MERVEVTDLLTFINQAGRTGLVEMEGETQSTCIFFRRGDPVFASSSLQGLHLGFKVYDLRSTNGTTVNMKRAGEVGLSRGLSGLHRSRRAGRRR